MATASILLAGFGGQGILFAAKQLAKSAMDTGKNVTWLPSYGPEMRGGTCNCGVVISDDEIGSPIVNRPSVLVAFNIQSFDKFEPAVVKGGSLFADSSLINKKSNRTDIVCRYIPATELASENGLTGMANVIMLGYILRETGIFEYDAFLHHMIDGIPASKAALIEKNTKALAIGYNYSEK
ncbi:MAG: 2-oxoacid:acceptor oxidoreductase family protein [Firmicutes bacterium]|nr:2-oxoacid:acceptor oxidoreductase family protein [Bacillota bacterium]